jgi:hypothetical protein
MRSVQWLARQRSPRLPLISHGRDSQAIEHHCHHCRDSHHRSVGVSVIVMAVLSASGMRLFGEQTILE